MAWSDCKRLIREHLKKATGAKEVYFGEDPVAVQPPCIFIGDTDGGTAEHDIVGARYFANTLYLKIVAANDADRERVMRQARQCWDKSTTAGSARATALCNQGLYNIYPQGFGERSLGLAYTDPAQATAQETFEGLLTFIAWYQETPVSA